jgi:DNA primase
VIAVASGDRVGVECIRAVADLAAIVGRYGVLLRKSGTQLSGLCPFHNERTPSFYVHPAKQVFKCHGCGAGGDAFTFIQKIEGVDFQRALEIVADLVGVPLSHLPLTWEQKREYAERQADRELVEHFRMREGIPDRESDRAAAAYRRIVEADPDYEAWLREDLEHAKAITALIVAMLPRAPKTQAAT